jgi:uncharacterized delta-60 repeat protein
MKPSLPSQIKSILIVALLSASFEFAKSQSIAIDSTFNGTGTLITDYSDSVNIFNFRQMNGNALALQPDGKIIIGGGKIDSQLICRYNSNGTVDSSFGKNGISAVYTNSSFTTTLRICILPNGKIIVLAGEAYIDRYCLYRYLSNGEVDADFGQDGKIMLDLPFAGAVAGVLEIQEDGKIILAGGTNQSIAFWPGFYMVRLHPDGKIDSSFGVAGEVKTYFNFISNNPLNGDFYEGGSRIVDLALQEDGKIIACGTVTSYWNGNIISDSMAIVRYDANGSLDTAFSDDGKFTFDVPNPDNPYVSGTSANSIYLQPNGKIVIGGGWYGWQTHGQWQKSAYTLLRLLPDGVPDITFDHDGVKVFNEGAYSESVKTFVQSDEKILLIGNFNSSGPFPGNYFPNMLLARVASDGNADNSFEPGGLWVPPYRNTSSLMRYPAYNAEMQDQRIYVFGDLPNQYDNSPSGKTLFAFKIDGVAANSRTLNICAEGVATTITSDLPGNSYQWQVSSDSMNFNDIDNDAFYNGVNMQSLSIKDIPVTWNSYQYRCVTEKGISNTTTLHILNKNENEWTGTVSHAWEEPGNWLCGTVPNNNSTVIVSSGNITIHSNVTIKSIKLQKGASLTVDQGNSLVLENVDNK